MLDDSPEVIDLSNPIGDDVPGWPTARQVDLDETLWAARDGVTMEEVAMTTHTGTHVDAPRHFLPEGKSLDDYPVSKFMGRGVAVDVAPKEPASAITVADLEPFAEAIAEAEVVLLHTGWGARYGKTPDYLFEFPYLDAEAAAYLAERDLDAVGTEGLSVGGWAEEVPERGPTAETPPSESHLPLLRNDVIPIEELRNLGTLLGDRERRWADVFFPPLNYQGTGGGSVRAFAVV